MRMRYMQSFTSIYSLSGGIKLNYNNLQKSNSVDFACFMIEYKGMNFRE